MTLPRPTHRTRSVLTRLLLALGVVIMLALVWHVTPLADYATPRRVVPFLLGLREESWAIPAMLGLYILCALCFFPLLVLVAATAVAFGPWEAFALAQVGALLGAVIAYGAGRFLGLSALRALIGRHADRLRLYLTRGGVAAVALLRALPVSPFTVTNLALGSAELPFATYLTGTLLGLLPGISAFCFLGDSLADLWRQPDRQHLLYATAGVAAWLLMLAAIHALSRRWGRAA
jgi:uncharacterized membrane protein YdjX (TVP38/TMEM64 family)